MKKIFSLIIAAILTVSLCLISLPISAEGEVDKSELEALIAEAKAINQGDYDADMTKWIMFRNMLGIVEGIYKDDTVDQAEVDSAVVNLRKRIDALGPKRSTETTEITETTGISESLVEEINSLLSEARAMQRSDYLVTDADWTAFQTQITVTENALLKGNESRIISNANNLRTLVNDIKARKNNNNATDAFLNSDASINFESAIIGNQGQPKKEMPKSTAPFSKGGFIYLGCGSTVAASALVVVGVIGAVLAFKKKED